MIMGVLLDYGTKLMAAWEKAFKTRQIRAKTRF